MADGPTYDDEMTRMRSVWPGAGAPAAAGDPAVGDPAEGDPTVGDPVAGDPAPDAMTADATTAGAPPAAGDPPPDERRPEDQLPFGRRRRTAASALVAMLIAFCLGSLFNAPAMKKSALELPFGGQRSFRLALVDPLAAVSHWLYLDRPAKLTAGALGRPDPGPTGPAVVVVVQPTSRPTSGGKPGKGGDKKPPKPPPLRMPYQGHPIHLYIAGDSMMGLPGMALTNLSIKTHLIKPQLDYHISSGLCRPDFYNWPLQLKREVDAFQPGAVVVMFGANDNQGVETASGKVFQFGTEGWKKEYRTRVADVLGLLFQGGAKRVFWVGQPVMPSSSYDRQIRLVNQIYAEVASKTPGVHYVDTHSLLSRGGRYTQYLPDAGGEMQQVREADGEHLTYAGGLFVAQAVLDAIRKEWFPREDDWPAPSPTPLRPAASGTPAT